MNRLTAESPTLTPLPCKEKRPPLEGTVVPRSALDTEVRERMYELLARYFSGVTPEAFQADLAEKEWVILLRHSASTPGGGPGPSISPGRVPGPSTGTLAGFSSLMTLRQTIDGEEMAAIFSGDTIVDRKSWGEWELSRVWVRHVFSILPTLGVRRLFWFLISSGYKTYRFLPVFFRNFHPTYRHPTPTLKRILDQFATLKFPTAYDPASGIVRLPGSSALRSGVAEVSPARLTDPHVAFYVAANPGYSRGEELACLVELSWENLSPAGRRMLGAHPFPEAP